MKIRLILAAILATLILIGCTATARIQLPTPFWTPVTLAPDHAKFESVVLISSPNKQGTGFVVRITDEVFILTAAHITRPNFIPVFVDGVHARMVATSSTNDLALIAVPNTGTYTRIYDFAPAKFDQLAWAVGFSTFRDSPLALIHRGRIVSLDFDGFIAFNGGGRPGMSGGPLLNCYGQVMGVLSFVSSVWGGPNFTQLCFTPDSIAKQFVTETFDADH